MLSNDELSNGMTFILKLVDAGGTPAQWVTMLEGGAAARWYDVYRTSDWAELRAHGGDVFRDRVSEEEAERVRTSTRCVVIRATEVKAEEMSPAAPQAKPREPGWENEGGSLSAGAVRSDEQGAAEPAVTGTSP
jgi:hypothetical protein